MILIRMYSLDLKCFTHINDIIRGTHFQLLADAHETGYCLNSQLATPS
jgi:hypothetical protein